MAFPVDVLTNVDHETLELTAEEYMSQLPCRNTEYFSLSDSKQIEIGLCNVSFVPLYGTDTEKKLLALFSPDDSKTVVGLYLLDRWWRVEDVLKTAEPSRTGLIKVSTLGERIVLYVLNRIVLRNEKSSEDVFFLCHFEHEAAKILWKEGEAIGFYSFKPKGSLCRNFVTQCYQLPVMDTIFVRKCHRGQGHAIKILEDFVGSFRNEYIGLKFPLSEAMCKVCEKYFSIYPSDKEFLWEVEKIGSPFQRTLIANRLQKLKLKEKDQVVSKLNFDEDDATAPMEIEFTKIQETTEYTVEIVEETIIDITKEVDDIPVTRCGRGSNLKRRAIRENSEERLSENVIRVEDIEAGVESSVEVAAMENLNTFSVKESETVLRSSVDTVTATVTNFAEFRGSQKEETREIEKDIVTATSEGSPVTHLTTAGEINNQRGSKEECETVIKEYTTDIQGATIGSADQSQLQSVVDVEIVKMSTGTEEEKNENLGKNKEVEEDEPVCEAEMEEIKQMPDEPKEEKTTSETEVAEQSETHAKSIEKVQAHWDVEITENKERAENEVMAESEKDLIEENRDDNTGQEKSEPKDEDTVLQQSVEGKDQIEMEADSVTEVLTTEEVLCGQPKQNEAETEVSEPNQTMTNKDTLIEKASKHKLGPDEAEHVFNKSKLPQKRTSGLTPSRRSKRLRHQPAEKDLKTTKSVKTGQQRSKHHSKEMIQDEDIEQSTDEPEHDVSEAMEIQEAQIEKKAEAESEVEEYKEKDVLTVETVSTMDIEITQVEETVFPEVSELVEREETDQEEAPLQSSVEPPEIQESKTTPEEEEETVQNSAVILTLSEAKVVLVDLHELSPKEAGDNHGEIGIPGQEEMKLTMSSEQQATEENMRKEEQDGTLDTKPMEEPACTTTTEGYDVAADANRTPEQSTACKDQEYEPESETTKVVLLSQVEKPEKTDFEQDKEDKQDLYEADKFPKQGNQTQKKGSINIPSRSTRLKDQPVDPGVTVRYLRSTLKPVKITPVRRSTHSKAVIQQAESVEPQVDAKLRTDENPEREKLVAEDVSPEENEMANTNADETASVECGSSELLRAAEIDDKEKENQITKVTGEIPLIETEAEENVLENRVEEIKKMENKEVNLAGQMDNDIEMSSLAQEVYVQEEEVAVSTERHLRRRTIRVQTPLIRKSRCVQKQKAEAAVEHQERHTVVSKNKTDTILMTKEREDEMDQDVNKMENKEEHFAELEPVEEPNMSRNEYEKTSAITEETVDVCIPIITTEASLESLDEMVNTNTEETAVPESSELPLGVEIDYQEKEFQIVDGPEEKVSLVEPDKKVENDNGTPVIKLQRATLVLVDLSKLSQNTEGEGEASEDLTHFQMEEKLELYEPDKSEQELSNLALEEEEQEEEVQTQEDTEKTPEEEKMEEENTVEEHNKLDKQDMTFEEQKPTEDLATIPAEGSLVESNKIENKQNEDEGVSGLAQENAVQENLEEEAPVSTQRSLRRRTIRVQSPPRRKSRRIQKQRAEVFEDETEIVLITEKEADEVDQGVEIVDKEKGPQTSIVDATEKVIPLVEAEPEDNVVEKGVEEFNKLKNKETNLAVTRDTSEETPEVGEESTLEQQQNEPLDKNDKETAETETSMEFVSVVGKEQTYMVGGTSILIEEKVSQVSLVEAEPDEEVEKVEEEKLEQDKPDNSEYQLCNLISEEEEQLEQLQKEEDTEKTPEKDKMEDENTFEEQNEPDIQDMTFEEQKPTEDLEEQNDLKVTEIVVYRAVDENVEEAVKSGEHPEKTTTMANETNIIQEAERDHNITFKEKQTDSDIEMIGLGQEASETDQEVLEEEASVSTERSLRRRTIKIQSPPRRKSRRLQKQEAKAFEDKTRNIPIRGKVVDEIQETLKKSTVETTEVIPFVEAVPEDNVIEKGVEEINKMEDKETNIAVTRDTGEETSEVEEEANLEQQQNEPLVKNDKETTETEKSMEIDPVVGKEQTYMVGGTSIQIEEKVSQVSLVEAEPDEEGEKDDGTPLIQLQKATVVLVDLNKLSQNTEGESDTPDVLTDSQTEEKLEQDKPDNSEYQLCNLTSEEEEQQEQLQKEGDTEKTPEKDKMEDENTAEEQNEPDIQDMTFEEQKPTENLEEQNDLKVTEIIVYRAVDENVEEAVKSGEHPEKTTTMANETNIIQEAERDHNITFKEKQTDSDIEMIGLGQEASETDQEVLEEEASVSTERSLRRRTIKIQSPPKRKSRRLQKQEAKAFEDKTRNIPIRGKVVDEIQETLKKSTVETTEVIPFVEAVPEDNVVEKGVEEINKMEDKETNIAVTRDTGEETSEVEEEANLEQQQNEPLVKNDKETTETEKSMEIDPVVGKEQTYMVGGTSIQIEEKVSQVSLVEAEPDEEGEKDDGTPVKRLQIEPVVSKEQAHVVGGTIIQIEEKFSQGESTETDQSDNEKITRRSLSAKSVTATQKTRKSTRLHKVELDPVKETNMSRNEHEATSAATEETVNVCIPIITVESNMESLDEMTNTNVEETTAVAPETSELLMGEEINDKEEASQILEEDKPTEAEPHEEVEKDDGTPVILQKDTLLLVDLNKLSQNTEEQTDTPEVLTHFHSEEQPELCEPDDSEYHLCNLTSEEDKQDMTVEGQKPTDNLVGQNDGKEREKVEEYKVVDEDVEESVSTGEHPKATTMEDKTNIIQETENNQDISLKEKQMDSDLEMRSLGQEAPDTVQEILEEEASVSTERSLRRRTVKIQSPPIKKSRRVKRQEAEVFEDKTGTVQLIGKGDEEVHKEGAEIDKEETLQKTTVEATENIVSLREVEPDENVIEKGFEEINNMENKETNLRNEATPEMERDKVDLEQQENELYVENEKETAETEKPMGMDEVSVVNREQTYILEETTIQAEEEILQIESSETNENKSERTTRRSLRISSQSVTSTQKTRKSARLNKAELEPVKEAKMSRNEETSSMTAKTVNVSVPVTIETNVENLDEDGDVSKRVETTSDEQDIDISNDKGRVDEALPEISTDVEEGETMTLIKITENEILVEMDKTQKDVEGGVQEEEKAEPSQENTEQEQEEAVSLGENVGETDQTNEFKTTAVEEKVALEDSEPETAFITRSLRYRTVTVQSTPRSKSKRLHRQELESGRETEDLNVPIEKENETLIAEDSTAEFENLETKEGECVIQTNTDGKSDKSETKDDTKEVGNEILFEIMEINSGSQVNTEQNKSREENLEREDMPVPNEQEEDEVSSVQKEAKPLQERENEGAAEGVEGSTADLEETAVERRSLRKRMTVETAAPRKSKRLRKQEHEDDSELVKETVMGQIDSEVTFTEDSVELRSDATGAVFEGSNLGEETLQKIQKNAQGVKSDGDCNVHKDREPDAGESQEEQNQSILNKTQADEDQEDVMTDEIVEQHVALESSTNEGFALALEVEETSDQEENKADEESRVVMEAPKEIFTSAEKYEKGEENISDDDERGLAIGKHVVQSSSTTASTRRKSIRLQMHESKTKEDESNSESEIEQTMKQRHQRKRKAITDSTSARRSKRHVRARIV